MNAIIFITTIFTILNIILAFGSAFLALAIILSLGKKDGYVLARGWRFFLPTVLIIVALRVYDFFERYAPMVGLIREFMYLVFTALLFSGLLAQYLAIRGVIDKRM
jgi:hypothetical protein